MECLDGENDPDVYMYKSMSRDYGEINFDKKGVYVLSLNTMKGLEFDVVLIPRCECIKATDDARVNKNMFYVATTRASEVLACFYFGETSSNKYVDVFGPIKGHENLIDRKGL